MALREASIFNGFRVVVGDEIAGGLTLLKVQEKKIKCKNDNFSSQVQVYNDDPFFVFSNARYLTFDNSTIFEITDLIKNGDYTTFFIQYLTSVRQLGQTDNSYYIDAITPPTLQQLNLSQNDYLEILGESARFGKKTFSNSDLALNGGNDFVFAVKIRLSEIPQNLNRYLDYDFEPHDAPTIKRGNGGNFAYAPVSDGRTPPTDSVPREYNDFTQFDNAVSVLLLIPSAEFAVLRSPNDAEFMLTRRNFLAALSSLITDLTLSIEITILSSQSLWVVGASGISGFVRPVEMDVRREIESYDKIILPKSDDRDPVSTIEWGGMLRLFQNDSESYPCIVLQTDSGNDSNYYGFAESLNYIYAPIRENTYPPETNPCLKLDFLGNSIDISKGMVLNSQNRGIYFQRGNQSIRVFTNFGKSVYTDVTTTFEFAKNAYSNYDAYQKSNIDMLNAQSTEVLKQQQRQQRDMQTINEVQTGLKAVTSSAMSFATGNIAGGSMNLLNAGADIAFSEMKGNLQRQNDMANLKLAQLQAHEKAASLIVPSSEIKGTVDLLTSFLTIKKSFVFGNSGEISALVVTYLDYPEPESQRLRYRERIAEYVIKNDILIKTTDLTAVNAEWLPVSYIRLSLKRTDSATNDKNFVIFGYINV